MCLAASLQRHDPEILQLVSDANRMVDEFHNQRMQLDSEEAPLTEVEAVQDVAPKQ